MPKNVIGSPNNETYICTDKHKKTVKPFSRPFRIPRMNKLKVIPSTSNISFEKPELLKRFPDIDYEMIPITDDSKMMTQQSNQFYLNQLPPFGIKNILRKARQFRLVVGSASRMAGKATLPISNERGEDCIAISEKTDLIVLLPVSQISGCKKSKKYTKIYLTDGRVFKTSISYKKLKKCLLKKGFTKYKKAI